MKFRDIILNAFHVKELRKKMFMTLLLIIIFRIGCFIPVPGLTDGAFNELAGNGMFKLYDMLSCGAFQQVSLFAMTISPYINASIIVQLLTVAIPIFEGWQKEGRPRCRGRRFRCYGREDRSDFSLRQLSYL